MRRSHTDLLALFWAAPDDALLDNATTAAGLSCTTRHLDRKIKEGIGPPHLKFPRKTLYRKADALKWLERQAMNAIRQDDDAAQENVLEQA
jgi:hypothetical protein